MKDETELVGQPTTSPALSTGEEGPPNKMYKTAWGETLGDQLFQENTSVLVFKVLCIELSVSRVH